MHITVTPRDDGFHHTHPSTPTHMGAQRPPLPRWLLVSLLVLVPLLTGAMGSSLLAYFSLDEKDLAWLMTVYSAPNLVLVFLGGVLMDRFGLVRTSLAFNLCVLTGMILFACTPRGSAEVSMRWLLCGRFLLGVGGGCICVAAQAMLARWFKGSEWLTFAMGFRSAMVQLLGSAPAFVLLPFLMGAGAATVDPSGTETAGSSGGNVRLCLWVIVIWCGLSVIANVLYALVDMRYGAIYVPVAEHAEFELQMGQDMLRLESQLQANATASTSVPRKPANARNPSAKDGGAYHVVRSDGMEEEEEVEMAHSRDRDRVRNDGGNVHDHPLDLDLELDEDAPASPSANGNEQGGGKTNGHTHLASGQSSGLQSPVGEVGPGGEHTGLLDGLSNLWRHNDSMAPSDTFSLWKPWQSVRALPGMFWSVLAMHCLLSPILYSFSAFGPQFFAQKYGMDPETAGFVTSLLYVAIILAPLFGALIDRFGYRATVQTVAAGTIPLIFTLMRFTHLSPYLLVCGLGVAFSIVESNGLAMIADVSPSALLGTSYALVGVGTSLFLSFEPYAVGAIHLHTRHYAWATVLFILLSSAGWCVSFAIYVWDVNHEQRMTRSAAQMRAEEEAQQELQAGHAYPTLDIVFAQEDDEDEHGLDDVDELDLNEMP